MFFAWSTPTDTPIIYWNLMQNQADLRKVGYIYKYIKLKNTTNLPSVFIDYEKCNWY